MKNWNIGKRTALTSAVLLPLLLAVGLTGGLARLEASPISPNDTPVNA